MYHGVFARRGGTQGNNTGASKADVDEEAQRNGDPSSRGAEKSPPPAQIPSEQGLGEVASAGYGTATSNASESPLSLPD
jgi:hypothetical protein